MTVTVLLFFEKKSHVHETNPKTSVVQIRINFRKQLGNIIQSFVQMQEYLNFTNCTEDTKFLARGYKRFQSYFAT